MTKEFFGVFAVTKRGNLLFKGEFAHGEDAEKLKNHLKTFKRYEDVYMGFIYHN